jgi:hypothetical protein
MYRLDIDGGEGIPIQSFSAPGRRKLAAQLTYFPLRAQLSIDSHSLTSPFTLLVCVTNVDNHVLLHDGLWSAQHLGLVPKSTLLDAVVDAWYGGMTAELLMNALIKHRRESQ